MKIFEVEKNSPADKMGISVGESLISINSNIIKDVLDYRFYMTEENLHITTDKSEYKINKGEYEDLGLSFESYLMDKQHSCKNACIFCFVDQMPKNMRSSLYFKDDDERMSFLFGNYITLTNLNDEDIDRIIKMRISPINISVHTTNPTLRVQMMKNPRSGEVLNYIKRLTDAGITVNTQLVLCPNYNDGDELKRSLSDLSEMYPHLQSIACVPVGLTKHREKLAFIEGYNKERAEEVISIIEEFSDKMLLTHGERVAYPADEFFILAERDFPDYDYYGDFSQLENGVGLITLLESEFIDALSQAKDSDKKRTVSIATGTAAYPYIYAHAKNAMKKYKNLSVNVIAVKNELFGESITVTGLLSATDIINALRDESLGEELIIVSSMLKHEEEKFLDDLSVKDLSDELNIDVSIIEPDGFELLGAMLGEEDLYL